MRAKNYLHGLFLGLAVFMLAGCNEQKIDATSDEVMEQSVKHIRDGLSTTQREKFDAAIAVLALSQVDLGGVVAGTVSQETIRERVRQSVHGKSAQEVIAAGEVEVQERHRREAAQALTEIMELEERRADSERARDQLKEFEVIRSRFSFRTNSIGRREPLIDLTVKNGTPQAVSRAYFEGTIASPARSVPWLKEQFSYSISGGLEPGEEASWTLAPNMFSEWGTVEAPSDAIFTVTVVRIDGADGEPIFSTTFDERDGRRLEELRNRYGPSE